MCILRKTTKQHVAAIGLNVQMYLLTFSRGPSYPRCMRSEFSASETAQTRVTKIIYIMHLTECLFLSITETVLFAVCHIRLIAVRFLNFSSHFIVP